MADLCTVSVKGVLRVNGKYLLRRNEREEWELPGGKLEKGDTSIESRLIKEFEEESGIKIKVIHNLEPWLCNIGDAKILIVPCLCEAVEIPDVLIDKDGGFLNWFADEELNELNMPKGYLCSIRNEIPCESFSRKAHSASLALIKSFLKNPIFYIRSSLNIQRYQIHICIANEKSSETYVLDQPGNPREFIKRKSARGKKDSELLFLSGADSVILDKNKIIIYFRSTIA